MSKRSTAGLIKYVKFLMDAGAMQRPVWLEAVERVPPPPLPKHGRKPKTITFPEDELIRKYYEKNPEAVLEPLDLTSFDPPTAKRFALRQLELIQQGMSRKDAAEQVTAEFAADRESQREHGTPLSSTIIEQIQAEEEVHLQQAVKTYIANHGHKPAPPPRYNRPGGPQQQQQQYQQQRRPGGAPGSRYQRDQRGPYANRPAIASATERAAKEEDKNSAAPQQ